MTDTKVIIYTNRWIGILEKKLEKYHMKRKHVYKYLKNLIKQSSNRSKIT